MTSGILKLNSSNAPEASVLPTQKPLFKPLTYLHFQGLKNHFHLPFLLKIIPLSSVTSEIPA
jgi:hypothetical protein